MEELPPSRDLTLAEASETSLLPGDTIVGLDRLPDFKAVELLCARQIDPNFNPLASELTRRPLDTAILPRNFYGNVRGTAAVMHAPQETLQAIRQRNGRIRPITGENSLTLMLCIDLLRGSRPFGTIARQVIYYTKIRPAKYIGTVSRYLGPAHDIKTIQELAAVENAASAERARAVARFALRHPFSGGLPGQH